MNAALQGAGPPDGEASWIIDLADLAATGRLAGELAAMLQPGDLLTLGGELGTGKTALARALLRHLADDPALEVPSPTFTLMQVYDTPRMRVVHADLYRIKSAGELAELGWEEQSEGALVMVEWAGRAAAALTPDRLDVTLIHEPEEGPEHRVAVITGYGGFAPRIALMKAIAKLLKSAGWAEARRDYMMGDASTRAYERLTDGDRRAILMISPPRADGPPVRGGKPYSAIAMLAEDVKPFAALAHGLLELGFSAPAILAADLKTGLLIIEDFGDSFIASGGEPVAERYMEAAGLLAELHAADLPDELPAAPGVLHKIRPYGVDAMQIEAELFLDWYLPGAQKRSVAAATRSVFTALWKQTFLEILEGPRTWTLRDYHSPNLMWLEAREGIKRIGLLDFQDAVIGHPAFDTVSLLQDHRVTVPEALEMQLLGAYLRRRMTASPGFSLQEFARAYAILGALRATKNLGIFIRLNERDGKPQYLEHIPRTEAYLKRCLAHPALSELSAWYAEMLPQIFGPAPR